MEKLSFWMEMFVVLCYSLGFVDDLSLYCGDGAYFVITKNCFCNNVVLVYIY